MAESKSKTKAVGKPVAKAKPATKAKPTSKTGAKAKSTASPKPATGQPASRHIDERIRSLGDWRGAMLAEVRRLIHEADPDITEEWKWMGTPVWSHGGIVCTGETYKQVVKLTFARGASLPDPHKLFNSSLDGNTRRAIDLREGEKLDAAPFKALIQAAVAENLRSKAEKTKSPTRSPVKRDAESKSAAKRAKPSKPRAVGDVELLSGGNPRIAKADGDAPVQAYIAALPGWKRELARRLDAFIVRTVPNVRKAVKWNSPFYGIEGQGWFLAYHAYNRYLKVTFFQGTLLRPSPTGGSSKEARWFDIHEADKLDEPQLASWLKQAAALPGWNP